jgi:hypothetical protein
MTDANVNEFVRRAEEVYATRLRAVLEPEYADESVAIEPESGDSFLGRTLSQASKAARKTYPNRLTHVMRASPAPYARRALHTEAPAFTRREPHRHPTRGAHCTRKPPSGTLQSQ